MIDVEEEITFSLAFAPVFASAFTPLLTHDLDITDPVQSAALNF
jgi:hypothetical protein